MCGHNRVNGAGWYPIRVSALFPPKPPRLPEGPFRDTFLEIDLHPSLNFGGREWAKTSRGMIRIGDRPGDGRDGTAGEPHRRAADRPRTAGPRVRPAIERDEV